MKNKFKVGQKVKYKTWGNRVVTGTIEKINPKDEKSLKLRRPDCLALVSIKPKNVIN